MPETPSPFAAIDRHAIPIEPLLRRILERSHVDPVFCADLDACAFQASPMTSDEVDCLNPWLFVIAMNGGGSAYGLYVHPEAMVNGVAPWAYWEHEDDTISCLASDTDRFFRGLVDFAASWSRTPDRVARARSVLGELGVRMDGEPVKLDFERETPTAWVPPVGAARESVDVYLGLLERDPARAERGLLAHRMDQDRRAREALDALYRQRGWSPPRTFDD